MSIRDLPAPSSPPKPVPSETVVLFRDNNWDSQSFTIKTKDFAPNQRHSISGSPMQDQATWIAFNLPPGIVVTLVDHYVPAGSSGLSDLKGAGRVVDLIGTGATKAIDLTRCNMNDCISAFFWRQVDLSMGAIELYEDVGFEGNRTVLFPAEWSVGKVISLSGWHIEDKLSSSRWDTLRDTQTAALFDNPDGSGNAYANISGYAATKEIENLKDVGFNDCASAFRWESLAPRKEEIAKFDLSLSDSDVGSDAFVAESSGKNDSSVPSTQTVSINETEAQTLTVTVSEAHTAGTKLGFSFSYKTPWNLVGGEATTTVSTELSYSYTKTDTTSKSATKTQGLTISQSFTAPPHSTYTGRLIAKMGTLAPTPFSTTAKRWYSEPLPETVQDPKNGWYARTENITGTVQGRLCCKSYMEVKSQEI
jgi:hypothetical protein